MTKPRRFDRVAMATLTRNLEICCRGRRLVGEEGRQTLLHLVIRLYECSSRVAGDVVGHLETEGFIRRGRQRRSKRRRSRRGRKRRSREQQWHFRTCDEPQRRPAC